MIRWGILGAGSVARRRVIPAMLADPGSTVQCLLVRDPERAAQLAGELGVATHTHQVEALVNDPLVDAVYVSSPVDLHQEHVLAAAEAGKHVLCEKPMARSAAECTQMIAACQHAGVHLELCFVLRGWPIYQQVRDLVLTGRLGRLVELRAHLAKWTPRRPDEWRLDPARSGGGALNDVGSHYLDLFRFLAGDFARIAYRGSHAVFGWPVEESGFALLEFAAGAHGLLSVSCTVPHAGHVLEIFGTEGTLLLGRGLSLHSAAGEQTWPVVYPDYYAGLLARFRAAVEEGAEPLTTGLDGLRNVEAIQTAYRSEREGRILELPR
jgi:predicted dehydrogenase